jgi:hypothetical protein
MNEPNKIIFSIAFVMTFMCVHSLYGQTNKSAADISTLTYNELIENKSLYVGKTVRLKAIWTYGFEWTYLCNSECKGTQMAWVEVVDESKLCKGTGRKLKKLGTKFDNRADVVVLGKLEEGMNGHMGAYPLRFTISCVEKYKKIY